MATRRSMLRYIGLGAVSAPSALKSFEQEALGLAFRSRDLAVSDSLSGGQPPSTRHSNGGNIEDRRSNYFQQLLSQRLPLPDFIEKELRGRAKYVYSLDHDIACKRSWSLSVKIITQQERNYHRMVRERRERGSFMRQLNKFQKAFGFWID